MTSERFTRTIERIDRLNSQDPTIELVDGVPRPRELVYSQRLTDWVLRLNPRASEELRIAARGQHLCRWVIPRDRYERNRRGYLRWRETLKGFHAEQVAALMREEGFPEETVARVSLLVRKKQLPTDPETQTLEDALCLVFLQTQFADLKQKTPDEKMRDIVVKTWKKMSEQGRAEATALGLPNEVKAWVAQAASGA